MFVFKGMFNKYLKISGYEILGENFVSNKKKTGLY